MAQNSEFDIGTNEGNNLFDIDFKDPKFQIESNFTDVDEFRLCVRQHNIVKNFNV